MSYSNRRANCYLLLNTTQNA